ncbi:autotransporter outer membrane beta-barrel domain-containing protein [Arenimonas sp.]|uniref:autotransporter outer membrane beta-barrel domain-containing protein n=1 Tax=Arenimonas sp. TaxID=1872635 RepID=UPI0039E6772F
MIVDPTQTTASNRHRRSGPKQRATTRAIRAALVLSGALLASGGNAVWAGTCAVSGVDSIACNGIFDTPAPDAPLVFAIDDLTVVVGELDVTSIFSDGVDGIQMTGATGSGTLVNYGAIAAYGGGDANAVDMTAYDDVLVENAGSLLAYVDAASGSAYDVTAVNLYSVAGDIDVVNQAGATISANASLGDATAIHAVAADGSVIVANAGDISASTYGAHATGIYADANGGGYFPDYSIVEVVNEGNIEADVQAYFGRAYSVGVLAYGYNVNIANDGSIDAYAGIEHGNSVAIGVQAIGEQFSTVVNGEYGDIDVTAVSGGGIYYGPDAAALGVFTAGTSAMTTNLGDISASATAYSQAAVVSAWGVRTYGLIGFATTVNYGDIEATSISHSTAEYGSYAFAYGAETSTFYLYYTATAVNEGNISATAQVYRGAAISYGLQTQARYAANYNGEDGVISAVSIVEYTGRANATGTSTYGMYYSHDVNAGTISAYALSHGSADTGNFTYGAANATGASQESPLFGGVVMVNSGDIHATAITEEALGFFHGGAGATGVYQYGKYYAGLENSGDITAYASSELGIVASYGVWSRSKYGSTTYVGNAEGASIVAASVVGSAAGDTYAGRAVSHGINMFGGSQALVYNDGVISASAFVDPNDRDYTYHAAIATAYGVEQTSSYGAAIHNNGTIQAYAGADFGYASAYGSYLVGRYYGITYNHGDILAIADADHGDAFAVAASAIAPGQKFYEGCGQYGCYYSYAGGLAGMQNYGELTAVASADDGIARAYGSVVVGRLGAVGHNEGDIVAIAEAVGGSAEAVGSLGNSFFGPVELSNAGNITASAEGDSALATGLLAIGSYGNQGSAYLAASVDNSGDIIAIAEGDYAMAIGVSITGRYDDGTYLINGEDARIVAAAYGADAHAVAVLMASGGYHELVNYGTIAATGEGERIAIDSSASAATSISNHGIVTGSILAGGGDDEILNWTGGVINLTNASIDLGTFSANGNSFYNYGLINVSGDNLIDMGGPQAAIPSLNPLPFYNYGTIDFQDGAPNDTLTIIGDFAGEGEINVDVSIINELSDMLYIDGSVVTGTVQTVNVDLGGPLVPVQQFTEIPVVEVTGVSVDSNFVLGDIDYDPDNSFLNLDFGLFAHINAANTSPDVHYLGIEVTGLNDPGTIAAAVAGGAQAMMNTQIGTWRQREGVISSTEKSSVTLWARVFRDKGEINPGHDAFNFGNGGNFNYDQKISGAEVGVDFGVTDEFRLGLLLAKTDGDLDLTSPGAGHASMDGDTWGVYGTWISPTGFYVDASYRWMDFDATMHSSLGEREVDGSAEAFNIEMGYAFTMANGLKVEPQFQYTRVNVDEIDTVAAPGAVMSLHGGDSSRARLGVALRKSFTSGNTVWTPHATLSAVREFDGENFYDINGDFFGSTNTEGTSALLELGVNADIGGNLAIFGGLNWQDGGAINNSFGGQLGIRYTFGKAGR